MLKSPQGDTFEKSIGVMFSQLYAKSSCPDIYLIPIQANEAGEEQGVPFQFNATVIKISRELNARRNTRFMGRCVKRSKILM
jgi:hypothetical protein